ncbi:diaminopimelate epimerase [Thermoanaerobacterium thermosaccharolyticum]|uniref:Diaminopimelate epimerase n=1 Tax=Thermoanaerobacterium thermosaccharolyticum (strain ATCC 7956 / DSM 571 / NCIMB 9385 / NCA 3814 / NCTC 13789 / WDCM 00135 / 2032) TaxID=580327 RepID=D9TNS5_THETC|nr:diaminopimelate epimerase [Thermoanaerobacterium thermosaccharolyticum]ADL69044.1 diaminopimelate epimerase [Thermoanaerobacterium thermosaccharolyticum DSM 571]KAA5806076.1 diaminopimelate epimerase [Thermoanaerobacterium thermosaccharolyticum]TCW38762.1 diaminopimelate epimerase [Thermohydrogenium kirishiense]
MKFTKMNGLGNDFIVFENLDNEEYDYDILARKLCDRHFGIGADGLLIVEPSGIADIKMRIINSDGSEAEMCGNGARCFAKYVYENGIVKKDKMSVETLSGIIMPELIFKDDVVEKVKVHMGSPIFRTDMIPVKTDKKSFIEETIKIDGRTYIVTSLLVGVPHTIIFVNSIDKNMILNIGPLIEKLQIFPRGTNVDFVKVEDDSNITVRTWERGAGLTFACGTGACASAVASALTEKTKRNVYVHFKKGDLYIEWLLDNNIYLTGIAEEVFTGEIKIV